MNPCGECIYCRTGREWSCYVVLDSTDADYADSNVGSLPSNEGRDSESDGEEFEDGEAELLDPDGKTEKVVRRRGLSDGDSLRNQQSTGRKRAAKEYPFLNEQGQPAGKDEPRGPCEWRGLGNAGGGKYPITGCLAGKQEARHHGPDKNTLVNTLGNVHRICHACHNRWHGLNDKDYDPLKIILHDPHPMTEDEMLEAIQRG